jgi:HK97 gp10 family phage protein
MADKFTAEVEGAEQLVKDLLNVGLNVNKSVVGAVRKGGRVIRNQAEANANGISQKPGKKTSLRVRKRKGFVVGSIFPAKGHAELRLVEYGTPAGYRWARKGGPFVFYAGNKKIVTRIINHPGTAARPWLRPAFDTKADEAARVLGDTLKDAIEAARIEAEGTDD